MARHAKDTITVYLNEEAENQEKEDVIFELEAQKCDICVNVEASYYFDPGRISGPPENCYPPEEEFEIINTIIVVNKVIFSEKEFALCFPKASDLLDSITEKDDFRERFNFEPDFDPPERDDY